MLRLGQLKEYIERASTRRSYETSSLDRNRRFLVTAYALTLGIVGPCSGALYALIGAKWLGLLATLIGVVCGAVFFAISRGLSTPRAATSMLASLFFLFCVAIFGGGGSASPVFDAILLIPITAGLLGGVRSGFRWAFYSGLVIASAAGAEHLDLLPEPFVLAGNRAALLNAFVTCFLIAIAAVVTFAQDVIHTQARKEADAARIVAEKANELKSHFLLSVSHELLTPLNGVLGLTAVLTDTKVTEEQTGLLDGVTESAHDLRVHIENLLDFAQIQAGVAQPCLEEICVGELTRDIVEEFAAAAKAKGLELGVEADDCQVSGDEIRISRCLRILVDNAIKFTPQGSVRVTVECTDDRARWTVIDTGTGISAEDRPHVFDSFRQLDGGTTRSAGGLGLGLAHLVSLVELLRGSFGVESRPGQGSMIWFEIPMDGVVGRAPARPTHMCNPRLSNGHQPEILLAEDDAITRRSVTLMLEAIGCRVHGVEHGKAVIELIAREQRVFDLVLLDCEMPVMTGYEATEILREQQSAELLPIVALTAHDYAANRKRCTELGMNDLLSKPVSKAQLCRVIEAWVPTTRTRPDEVGSAHGLDARREAS